MIKNFEEYTVELNQQEESFARAIAKKISLNIGKNKAVTNKKIQDSVLASSGIKLSDPKIRKIIQYIRQNNLAPNLCATSKGYFVAANEIEYNEYIEGLKQRLNSIQFTLKCMQENRR